MFWEDALCPSISLQRWRFSVVRTSNTDCKGRENKNQAKGKDRMKSNSKKPKDVCGKFYAKPHLRTDNLRFSRLPMGASSSVS